FVEALPLLGSGSGFCLVPSGGPEFGLESAAALELSPAPEEPDGGGLCQSRGSSDGAPDDLDFALACLSVDVGDGFPRLSTIKRTSKETTSKPTALMATNPIIFERSGPK